MGMRLDFKRQCKTQGWIYEISGYSTQENVNTQPHIQTHNQMHITNAHNKTQHKNTPVLESGMSMPMRAAAKLMMPSTTTRGRWAVCSCVCILSVIRVQDVCASRAIRVRGIRCRPVCVRLCADCKLLVFVNLCWKHSLASCNTYSKPLSEIAHKDRNLYNSCTQQLFTDTFSPATYAWCSA